MILIVEKIHFTQQIQGLKLYLNDVAKGGKQ